MGMKEIRKNPMDAGEAKLSQRHRPSNCAARSERCQCKAEARAENREKRRDSGPQSHLNKTTYRFILTQLRLKEGYPRRRLHLRSKLRASAVLRGGYRLLNSLSRSRRGPWVT